MTGLLRRSSRRFVRQVVLGVTALSFIGFAVWMAVARDPDASNFVATVGGLFVGLASLGVALVDFFREEPARPDPVGLADDLASTLRRQWLEEARARSLRDPRVLPLSWTTTSRDVADRPAGGVLRVRLDGQLDGRFEEVTRELAEGFQRVPNRRLVVLGEPGAGKTVLAILLTLGLLQARDTGSPLPALLSAASWDPVREPLDDWLVRTLAAGHYNGRQEIPRLLLEHGLLLPVLDGIDEIPESARRSAVRSINQAIGGERPIVITCRAAEYEDLIRGGAPTLRRAPVVEVSPVPPGDVIGYLRDADWPEETATGWEAVFDHLRAEPDGPVGEALSTPLMVSTARLVYRRYGADPAELLDTGRFDCRYAVEEHLTLWLVDSAYAVPDSSAGDGSGRWDPVQARRWLTFLACYLHDHRERDLAWWRMSGRLLSAWFAPAAGLGVGMVLAVLSVLTWDALPHTGGDGVIFLIAFGIGVGFAILATVVWYAAGRRPPGRLSPTVRGSWARLRHGFVTGIALTAVSVAPLLVGFAAIMTIPGDYELSFAGIQLYCQMVMTCCAMAAVIGLALAAHNWLDAPPTRSAQIGPLLSVAQDRRSAVVGALTAGTVVGATGLLGWIGGNLAGNLIFQALTRWPGWPGHFDLSDLAESSTTSALGSMGHGFADYVGPTVLLPAVVFGLLVLLTRAWPRFVLVRLILAARRQLPWRLMAFLADARERCGCRKLHPWR